MEFITTSTGKKRQMIIAPAIDPNTFLLFFEKGDLGYSWSLRDYSQPDGYSERYAREFGCSASELRKRASLVFDAPTVPTTDLTFWHAYTKVGNEMFVRGLPTSSRTSNTEARAFLESKDPKLEFPVLNLDVLRKLPKASKRQDLERMLQSRNSEDWVTWNLFTLLLAQNPKDWHVKLSEAATRRNPEFLCSLKATDIARVELWKKVKAPAVYEQSSRERMRRSGDAVLVARSFDPKPVEGESEIDAVISTDRHLIFIEAKLGSDISMRTTYDSTRNQIARNIDCLLESASGREAYFWMLARDSSNGRMYSQLLDHYRANPDLLARLLPHRDTEAVRRVCKCATVILWSDLKEYALEDFASDSGEIRFVKHELRRRVLLVA